MNSQSSRRLKPFIYVILFFFTWDNDGFYKIVNAYAADSRQPSAVSYKKKRGKSTEKKFEEAVGELERVVEQLESGELSLEDSLAAFENGVRLVKLCNQKLTEVERKIELLVKDKDGKLQLKPLEDLGEEDVNEEEK